MRKPYVSGSLLALLASVSAFGVAHARPAPAPAEAADPVSKVLKAPDPKKALEGLDAKEKADFNARMQVADVTLEDGTAEKVEDSGAKVAGQSCWKGQTRGSAKAAAGNTLFTFWVNGRWCASGGRVTKASFTRADGETKTPGWRYDGVKTKGGEAHKGQARVWAKHRFILGAGGIDIKTDDRCLRLNGTANGKIKGEYKCDVW
ncbi:hypothetical protein F0U59_18100 [Archangium gephyra]|nr:hypothetical protein F0U59_18100 [Archangium gephyra]